MVIEHEKNASLQQSPLRRGQVVGSGGTRTRRRTPSHSHRNPLVSMSAMRGRDIQEDSASEGPRGGRRGPVEVSEEPSRSEVVDGVLPLN